ncbi:hypothetical protein MVEN_01619000 [Mycena venus]|uniref:Uncharacterized protein n=1 Tax=Mycena venus TaxID=2733690 RepID=A0A8H6XTD3_9AGAR|nr:hypothetical protein MVEN_01619000 [Mycena venus]
MYAFQAQAGMMRTRGCFPWPAGLCAADAKVAIYYGIGWSGGLAQIRTPRSCHCPHPHATSTSMPGSQQQPSRPQPPNANANARRTLSGRISALSASLRMRSPRTQEGEDDAGQGRQDDPGAWAETSTLVEPASSPSRGYLAGRGGFGNFHADARPPPPEEPEPEFPWPRGRSREPRRGSHSTGRGGYGNIASGRNAHAGPWSYSAQEQELLRAHAEARRVAIPVGRGGYGNIAHARALAAEAAATVSRSQSVDPVAAPTSMSFNVPPPRARIPRPSAPHQQDQNDVLSEWKWPG